MTDLERGQHLDQKFDPERKMSVMLTPEQFEKM